MPFASDQEKLAVQEFWNRRSCGEVYATGDTPTEQLDAQARARYDPRAVHLRDSRGLATAAAATFSRSAWAWVPTTCEWAKSAPSFSHGHRPDAARHRAHARPHRGLWPDVAPRVRGRRASAVCR